jgi:hypothetical protein
MISISRRGSADKPYRRVPGAGGKSIRFDLSHLPHLAAALERAGYVELAERYGCTRAETIRYIHRRDGRRRVFVEVGSYDPRTRTWVSTHCTAHLCRGSYWVRLLGAEVMQ